MCDKFCIKCGLEKPLDSFVKNEKSKDGVRGECIDCYKAKQKEYREKNKVRQKEHNRKYREENRDKLLEYHREYNKKEDVKESKRVYKLSEKGKAQRRETRKRTIYDKWRNILHSSLDRLGRKKEGNTIDLLGYSALELKEHLEYLFTDGMSWDNHGEWHIDHIIPVSEFYYDTHPSIVNALENLQPLWATTREINGVIYEGNLNKGNNIK